MELADKFNIPIITFIDTPELSIVAEAEVAEAIARSIESCMKRRFNIVIVIGEGIEVAIALASASKVIMLENSNYSKYLRMCNCTLEIQKTLEAAEAMKLTSKELFELNI